MSNSYDAHDLAIAPPGSQRAQHAQDLDQIQPPMQRGSDHENDRKAAIDGIRYSIAKCESNARFWVESADALRGLMEKMEHQK